MYFYQFFFVFIVLCTLTKTERNLTCPPKNECDCEIGNYYETHRYEIFCPNRNNSLITVRIEWINESQNKDVHIFCNKYNANVYNKLPELNVGDASFVELNRCSLISGTIIRDVFNRLNIQKFQSLTVFGSLIDEKNDSEQFLREYLFDELPSINQIHEISIEYTNVSKVHENCLTKTTNLNYLSLAHNVIVELSPNVFDKQTNLWELDLSFNRLTDLDHDIFKSTSNLKILCLSHNQLTKISSHFFSGLNNLRWLDLQNNRIYSIHMTALDHTDLRTLLLQNNFIEFSNDALDFEKASPFQNLVKLEQLNMRNNSIDHFLGEWNTVNMDLKEIDLSYNKIRMINFGSIMNTWVNEIWIDLSHNQISTILTNNKFVTLNESHSTWILNDNPLNCDCQIVHFANYSRYMTPNKPMRFIIDGLNCTAPSKFAGKSPVNVPLNELICPLDTKNANRIKLCPQGCDCFVRTVDSTAVFNCSNANLVKVPALPNIRELRLKSYELYIEYNNITMLPLSNVTGYNGVRKLFAKNNSIDFINWDHLPKDLIVLDVSNNRLKNMSDSILQLAGGQHMRSVSFGGNPWICNCAAFGLVKFIKSHPMKIQDINDMICSHGQHIKLLNAEELCPTNRVKIITLTVAALIGLLMFSLMVFYHVYQLEIIVWLIVRCNCSLFVKRKCVEKKRYDAFIIYQDEDGGAVEMDLIEKLENKDMRLKLCSLNRDALIGSYLFEEVATFVNNSRQTIIILTPHLVDDLLKKGTAEREAVLNFWGFRLAHATAMKERRSRVVIIAKDMTTQLMERIRKFDTELDAYLNTNIYLKWNDAWLIDKIRLAIGHPEYFKSKTKPKSKSKRSQLIDF